MLQSELIKLRDSMSLQEKIDQMLQLNGQFYEENNEDVLTGPAGSMGFTEQDIEMAGSILGAKGAERLIAIQKAYMEKQPHHIPMLFMLDVIHGLETVFPAPLGLGATFEPELAGKCASAAAKEAAVSGLHVTFSPMVDLVRDARWGRVMESTGEDPYLNGLFAAEQVKGFQGEDMSEPYKICACIKHFAAYGAPNAGRDYNTVELSEHTLRDFYLKSYKAGIDAGAGMVMTSFNTVNGVPASTNKWLMRDILRGEMGFDGVLISDYAAILETIPHGHSASPSDAAVKALEAGVDIDMMTSVYSANLLKLVEEGVVPEALIDEAVLRILELKNKLGLFENPYKDGDPEKEKEIILCEEHRALARETAAKSLVLLENDGILPLDTTKKVAFIGPYTSEKHIISSWAIAGNVPACVTIEEAAGEVLCAEKTSYHKGCTILGSGNQIISFTGIMKETTPEEEELRWMEEACEAAKEADIVVMPLGEHYAQSGEASSRAMIDVPEVQMRLFRRIKEVNENIVVLLFHGRPLDLRELKQEARAVLACWIPGTEGGHAIMDVLTGKVNPSGKLPMSFPYCVGQVPVFYNEYQTGRPFTDENLKFLSRYMDIPNKPLYPFGYGLSYTSFEISPVKVSSETMKADETLTVSAIIKNTGGCSGTEVVQLYIQDQTASVVRPVKELKGLQKVTLQPGEEKEVSFAVTESMLQFTRADGTVGSEPGIFSVWIGNSSETENKAEFDLKK
ncbi:MAG: beta-glucosidase BglX [Bacillota bacterium]|nr:beta-glucosidase BglX [Bacillota bacterium]